MELRDLRAFVAAAHELHFARAAAQLYMSPSTMSEVIRKLELELGTPLFERTTRRITLTDAGSELLGRAEAIIALAAQATESIKALAQQGAAAVRLGITPPAAAVIAPHLAQWFTRSRPELAVDIQRMWLPDLGAALRAGTIDAALTCGDLGIEDPHITSIEIGSEPLLVGLRPDHPLAGEACIDLHRLADRTLGMHSAQLFPAWHAAQRQILAEAEINPPPAELDDTDLTAHSWSRQPEVDWIMLTHSLFAGHQDTAARPVHGRAVPFTLSWPAQSSQRSVVRCFVETSLQAELPAGWLAPLPHAPSIDTCNTPTRDSA